MPDPMTPAFAVLVLAAGGGSRLGGGKLLLPWRGKPILAHVIDLAARVEGAGLLVAVTGCDAGAMLRVIEENIPTGAPPVKIAENRNWHAGQSGSLRLGVAEIERAFQGKTLAGIMVMLGDQPLVRAETLDLLARRHIQACRDNPAHPATAPVHNGKRGNPVVLSPTLFPEIAQLSGDVGARNILKNLGNAVLSVLVDDPGVLRDVDTPDDYAALTAAKKDKSLLD